MKLTNRKMSPGDWNNLAVSFNRMAADTDARRERHRLAQERQEYEDAGAMRLAQRNSPAMVDIDPGQVAAMEDIVHGGRVGDNYGLPDGATPVGGLPWIDEHVPESMTAAKAWDEADTLHARARVRADAEEVRRFGDALLKTLAESPDPGAEFNKRLSGMTNLNQIQAAIGVMNELTTATNAGSELMQSKRAAIDVQYAAIQEVSEAAVNAHQRGDQETAARILEQLSEKLNIPYKYVHDGNGMMEVQTLDANTNKYVTAAGAAGLVPVDEAIESLQNLTKEEFAYETEKNQIAVKKLNETDLKPVWNGGKEYILHTWRNPNNVNDVAYFVYDKVTKERIGEYESHDDLTLNGGFMTEEHATSSAKVSLANEKVSSQEALTQQRLRGKTGGGDGTNVNHQFDLNNNTVWTAIQKELAQEFPSSGTDELGAPIADHGKVRMGMQFVQEAWGAGLNRAQAVQYAVDMGSVVKTDAQIESEVAQALGSRATREEILAKAQEVKAAMDRDVDMLRQSYLGRQTVGGLPRAEAGDEPQGTPPTPDEFRDMVSKAIEQGATANDLATEYHRLPPEYQEVLRDEVAKMRNAPTVDAPDAQGDAPREPVATQSAPQENAPVEPEWRLDSFYQSALGSNATLAREVTPEVWATLSPRRKQEVLENYKAMPSMLGPLGRLFRSQDTVDYRENQRLQQLEAMGPQRGFGL